MQFYFIRHGQSANNALWDATKSSRGRSHDPELTPTGVRQAELLGAHLAQTSPGEEIGARDGQNRAGFRLTHLYCSLMLRAVQTGSIVSETTGLPLDAWIDAHEEGGLYLDDEDTGQRLIQPGFGRAHFQRHYPRLRLPDDLDNAGWWNRPFEEFDQRVERAGRFLDALLQRHGGTDDRVAVISHGGFYNLLVHGILRLPLSRSLWFVMNNTAITRIDFTEDEIGVVYMNRTAHLPSELVT